MTVRQTPRQIVERFTDRSGECWLWTGAISANGYGRRRHDGRSYSAHRFAYEAFVGEIPPGLQIDHLCRVRACVNPAHLEAVTAKENQRRGNEALGIRGAVTHCPHGHRYDEANTKIKDGSRHCRTCARDYARRVAANRRVDQALQFVSVPKPHGLHDDEADREQVAS